ncbi:hypothetical protein PWJ43_21770, partial [Streptomyces sp. BE230]|nr:hypothetical protein [Streptomyces sp. BE230]
MSQNQSFDSSFSTAEIGVAPRSWDTYKSDPALTEARVEVGGIEHWPRGTVRRFQENRPGRA